MTKEEFRKLQLTQLEIMDEIHKICVENNIVYYIIGGTALGAVRHEGFIPWDLDIDIAMRRSEYDRFKEICKIQLDSRFIYRDYTNSHNYDHPHALVCIKNTILENRFDKFNTEQENFGIYLDIFPLDNAPTDEKLKMKQKNKLIKISTLKRYKVGKCYNNYLLKRLMKKVVSAAIFWSSVDKLNAKQDKCMRLYNEKETDFVCSMASHYPYEKQYMPKDIYGKPQLVDFEGRQYYAPQKLEEYLTRIYKDYMKLPPKEEQKANLDAFERVVFDR